MLQCIAVCCSVLQCVAKCCSCRDRPIAVEARGASQVDTSQLLCCNELQCVQVCSSVLQ